MQSIIFLNFFGFNLLEVMARFDLNSVQLTTNLTDVLPRSSRRQQQDRSALLSGLSLGSTEHQTRNTRGSFRRSHSTTDPRRDSVSVATGSSIAWQTMHQHLNLQLEEYQRASELAGHHRRQSSIVDQQQSTTVRVDRQISSVVTKDFTSSFNASNADFISEFENATAEDKALLTTDIHIVPIVKLVERFNSNLEQGLTSETIDQHRHQYGHNKLTPPPKPSYLWMFIKQSIIGFNGLLWFATLFAFLSYVSRRTNMLIYF